jgi:lipopolysaccharide assembly protein A
MRWLRRLLITIILLLVLVFGLLFSLQNAATVPLDLLVAQLTARPLAVWLLIFFALGGLAGLVASSVALIRLQASRFRLRRRLESCERELSELKSVPLKR